MPSRSNLLKAVALAGGIAMFVAAMGATGSDAAVFADDFNDDSMNTSLWVEHHNGAGPTVAETNHRVEIALPASSTGGVFSAGYDSLCQLRGDFDVRVDYHLLVWPSMNGVRVGLGAGASMLSRVSYGADPPEVYLTDLGDGVQGITATADASGTLRQTRIGGTATAYYLSASGWVPIHSFGSASTADASVHLWAWGHYGEFIGEYVGVAFDNLIVDSGQLVCPASPTDTPTATFTATATATTTPTATPTPTPTATATSCACSPTSTNTPTATPPVSVGGIAEQPEVAALPSAAASSGRNYTVYTIGAAVAFVAAAAGAVGWRKRRQRA